MIVFACVKHMIALLYQLQKPELFTKTLSNLSAGTEAQYFLQLNQLVKHFSKSKHLKANCECYFLDG